MIGVFRFERQKVVDVLFTAANISLGLVIRINIENALENKRPVLIDVQTKRLQNKASSTGLNFDQTSAMY